MTHSNTFLPTPIPRLDASTSFLRSTNKVTPEVLSFLIISSNGHTTERISEFVDYHLKFLAQSLPSYIKDTTHFLLQLKQVGPLPDNAILVALDVSSQYANIPHNEGIEACRNFLNTRQDRTLPTERICDLIRIILGMNNFSFNNEHFL